MDRSGWTAYEACGAVLPGAKTFDEDDDWDEGDDWDEDDDDDDFDDDDLEEEEWDEWGDDDRDLSGRPPPRPLSD